MIEQSRVLMLLDNGFAPDPRVAKEARALAAAHIHATIVAWDWEGGRPEHEHFDGYEVIRINLPSGRGKGIGQLGPLLRFVLRAALRSRSVKYDALYVHDLPLLPLGVLLSVATHRPLLYDAHELYWLMEYKKYPWWLVDTMREVEALLVRRAHTIVTVSSPLATYFQRVHPRVTVVGNWYDAAGDTRNQARASARQALGIPDGAVCVGAIGALARERHVDSLIEATGLVSNFHALIAGRGEDEERLTALASHHPNAHFLGWHDNPADLFAACDALYYGLDMNDRYSRYSSPNTLFQALAQGIPLLTTPIGEGGQVVRTIGCGLLLDPLSPQTIATAVEILQETDTYALLCQHAHAAQTTFSWATASERLVQTVLAAAGAQKEDHLCVV